jgi:hypothetical protein
MREPDEAAWVVSLCLVQVVVDQAALGRVRLIQSRATGEHCKVDACPIHHPHVRRKVGEQRVKAIIWIAILVEANGAGTLAAFHQLQRRIMMLEINDHLASDC